jgi:hypothetical protein
MSDTPRTASFCERPHVAWDAMWVDFARELERENAKLLEVLGDMVAATSAYDYAPTTADIRLAGVRMIAARNAARKLLP